ncbi:myoglobin-like [Babylonia areolata]|uniref:myoglobin-like n=1 Tax=Babylonia areolata TaxID=304850 RepID=UPI003FD576E6
MDLDLEKFCVSETTGFALENPLTTLPDYFAPWHRLATEMPQRIADGSMRQETLQMALLDWTRLEGHRQQRLAHLQLIIITMGYVWQDGDEGAAKGLPACVAVPLCGLSKELGIMPVLTHSDLGLANYRLTDPTKPLELDNMSALYCLPGGKEAEWFVIVTAAVEIEFGKGIKALLMVLEGLKRGDEKAVTDGLVNLTHVVDIMKNTFSRMHEKLSAATFFNTMRPYLGGWGGEDNPLPDGLIYEGVSDQPLQAKGGSAAQSGIFQALDALMGVQHSPENSAFFLTMRRHMLPGHQHFIAAMEDQSENLQDMVRKSTSEDLRQAFDNLLSAVIKFRSYHIQIVSKYIVQASRAKQTENKCDYLDASGTGGSDLLPFLKGLREATRKQMMTTNSTD